MKRIQIIKMTLNTISTMFFISMFYLRATGLVFHEVGGIALLAMFLAHLLLNRQWIIGVTRQIFARKVKPKILGMYILNILTLVSIIVVTVTGFYISKIVFPQGMGSRFLVEIHKLSAYGSIAFCTLHVMFHLRYIISFFKKLVVEKQAKKIWGAISSITALAIVAGMFYNQFLIGLQGTYKKEDFQTTSAIIQSSDNSVTNNTKTSVQNSNQSSVSNADAITLNSYLGNLHCTACYKHCSLLAPQCGRGDIQAQQATVEYNKTYKTATE